ncbi:hypothetical protein BC332_06604 [Capsicum chinense]|nr:hypothetical protein BC332_06604 [Capsicum chinense]
MEFGIAKTPLDVCFALRKNEGESESQLEYARVLECLMYIMNCTRSDMACAISKLSRYTSNPNKTHWMAMQRVLGYLKYTQDYALHYKKYPAVLEGYSDANWITGSKERKDNDERSSSDNFSLFSYSITGILVTATDDKSLMLLAKSLECITMITAAVGNLEIVGYLNKVTAALISLQQTHMEEEDPMRDIMVFEHLILLQAWGGLCKSLGVDFIPYLSFAMPIILKFAALKNYLIVSDNSDDESNAITIKFSCLCYEESMVHIQARLLEAFNESIQIPGSHLSKRQAEEFVNGISKIGICLGTMVEKLKASFLPLLDKFLPYHLCGYYEEWIPLLPRVHCHKNPSVPQIVATAIGICAEFGAYFLKLHTTVIFRHLKTVMEHPDAKNLDNIMAYEAAVSTCGKLNQFVVKAATTMRFNLDEAKISHKMLCSMMEMSEEKVIGPGGSYIPITIFLLRSYFGVVLAKNSHVESRRHNWLASLLLFSSMLTYNDQCYCPILIQEYLQQRNVNTHTSVTLQFPGCNEFDDMPARFTEV